MPWLDELETGARLKNSVCVLATWICEELGLRESFPAIPVARFDTAEDVVQGRASGARCGVPKLRSHFWIALISEQNRGFDNPHARSGARFRSCSAPYVHAKRRGNVRNGPDPPDKRSGKSAESHFCTRKVDLLSKLGTENVLRRPALRRLS
jgi:hypothetical protein